MELKHYIQKIKRIYEDIELSSEELDTISKYGRKFHLENINRLTKDDFVDFFRFKNNNHWKYISRHVNTVTNNMNKLKLAIKHLLDENLPMVDRYNDVIANNGKMHITQFGRAKATPILFLAYPESYCVYNDIVEKAMKRLDIFPEISVKDTEGEIYQKINNIVLDISKKYELSIWKIDHLWWNVIRE